MSNADRSQYAEAVTQLSEGELQDVISTAEPPVCLLGGWAVHLHVTDGFQDAHGRPYIGSRDIDLGIHVDPDWSREELDTSSIHHQSPARGGESNRNSGTVEAGLGFTSSSTVKPAIG